MLYVQNLKKKRAMLLSLIEREKPRKKISDLYKTRGTEGAFHALVGQHLNADEEKFREYFRLTKDEFQFVLGLIRADVTTEPCNRVKYPITPEEKLAITLRYVSIYFLDLTLEFNSFNY